MQTLDLNKMGLEPMTEFEMQEVNGGSFWKTLLAVAVIALAAAVFVDALVIGIAAVLA